MTTEVATDQARLTIADNLRRMADFADEHPEEVSMASTCCGLSIMLRGGLDTLRALFPGATAQCRTNYNGAKTWTVRQDGIEFSAHTSPELREPEELTL